MIRVAYKYLGVRLGTKMLLVYVYHRFLRWHTNVGVR